MTFDPEFLGVAAPMPVPAVPGTPLRELGSTHFTVLLQPERRLALATGVNVDGASLREIERGDDWHYDERVPESEQTGPEVYADNDLDRGHLVRRRDPVWGSVEAAERANAETFAFPNAAPQASLFNQGEVLWLGLEDYLLEHARAYRQRLTVFTAPVLDEDDPAYRGTQVPRRFWKVAAWADHEDGEPRLASTGYLLDQSQQLDEVLRRELAPDREPPPLGGYLTYQVPVGDLAALTGLDLGPLVAADRLAVPTAAPADRWVLLGSAADIRL